jgi:hypothetical protein
MTTGSGVSVVAGVTHTARPKGDVASPLLANIYMNRFLKHWRLTNRGKRSVHGSSPTPTTSSSLAADVRPRLWRGPRR